MTTRQQPKGAKGIAGVIQELQCLPDKDQLLLLKAALFSDQKALNAWNEWVKTVDFERTDSGSYRLFPLVYSRLVELGVESSDVLLRLKGAYRYHWAQTNKILMQSEAIFQALLDRQIPVLALKGASVALKYYEKVAERPMTDVDMLVPRKNFEAVIQILREQGCELKPPFNQKTLEVRHALSFGRPKDGLEVDVHVCVHFENLKEDAQARYWNRSVPMQFNKVSVATLCDTDHLYHALVHGMRFNKPSPIRWIVDAMMIIDKATIDWPVLVENARTDQQNLTVWAALAFLQQHFEADIPPSVFAQLEQNTDWGKERKYLLVKTKQISSLKDRYLLHYCHYKTIRQHSPLEINFWQYLNLAFGFQSQRQLLRHFFQVAWKTSAAKMHF